MLLGRVEVDGKDISNRVQSVKFERKVTGASHLTLGIVLYGDDLLDLEIPDSEVRVNATVVRGPDDIIEATAIGDAAKKYVKAAGG
jgi:hypothetical protein